MTSKYDRLADHLAVIGAATITLTFTGIKAIVGPLPVVARRDTHWWDTTTSARYAVAWRVPGGSCGDGAGTPRRSRDPVRRMEGCRMILRGPRDLWLIPLILAILGWDGIRRRWRALLARLRPAALTAGERHLLRERARRAAREERGG